MAVPPIFSRACSGISPERMSDFLQQMAASSAERAATARRRYRDNELDLPVLPLRFSGFDVIAEIKEHSPSEGALAGQDSDRLQRARHYATGGAIAVSVLTEPSRFGGELAHLRDVAAELAAVGIPAMRKDFLVDPAQLLEARAHGASGALLITAMQSDDELIGMLDCAIEHSLFVLLEAFDEDDLQRTAKLLELERFASQAEAGQLLVGVNTRNLRTLAVDPNRLQALAARLPANAYCVAESGLQTAADAAAAANLGYRLGLVGTALMRAGDPAALLRDMCAAGREALS
jgi:indole-3-glycerol phosphate synthase